MGTPSAVDKQLNGPSRRCSSWEHFRFVCSSLEFEVELAVIVSIVVVLVIVCCLCCSCCCFLLLLRCLNGFLIAAFYVISEAFFMDRRFCSNLLQLIQSDLANSSCCRRYR